jgi:hypothetical protein
MIPADRRLLRHLAAAVVIKLLLLAALWAAFVRGAQPPVDAQAVTDRLGAGQAADSEGKQR